MKKIMKTDSMRSLSSSSTQRVIINWLNSFQAIRPVSVAEIPEKFRTGVFGLKLLKATNIADIKKSFLSPKSREQCLQNISIFLNYISQQGFFESSPDLALAQSALQSIYQGKSQVIWLVLEFFFNQVIANTQTSNPEVLIWCNQKLKKSISYEKLAKNSNDGTLLGLLIQDFCPDLDLEPKPQNDSQKLYNAEELQKSLAQYNVTWLFSPEDFIANTDNGFMFMQIYFIYKFVKVQRKIETFMSTGPSSKNSVNDIENVFNNKQDISLENMEKKVANEERKLMFICDLRNKMENKCLFNVPSVREIPHCLSQPILSQQEIMVCYLLTPRIVEFYENDKMTYVLINLIPDKTKFSLRREKYLIECKEIKKMELVFLCEIDEIEDLDIKPPSLYFYVRRECFRVVFKSLDECEKYCDGLERILERC